MQTLSAIARLALTRPSFALQSLTARHAYAVLAGITLLLVGLICADAVHRGLDRNFPSVYRNTASLGIAISELCHRTHGFVGLKDVSATLTRGGFLLAPDSQAPFEELAKHPDRAAHVLVAACRLSNVNRAATIALDHNETGMIDYYMLALSAFGYHLQAFFWLFAALLALAAGCYLVAFRNQPAFLLASVFWLLLLFLAVHQINPTYLQIGTPANPRFIAMFSFYAIIFPLALSASKQRLSIGTGVAAILTGVIFGFCANTRTYIFWQTGPVILLLALAVIAGHSFGRFMPGRRFFAGCGRWPLALFGIAAIGTIAVHHARKDAHAYATNTFAGHEYWDMILDSTMDDFAGQIPQLEKRAGFKIGDDGDSYVEALRVIKIKERGEKLKDYILPSGYWDMHKREALARHIVFDFWREHPFVMLGIYLRALGAIFGEIWYLLPKLLIAFALFAFGILLDRAIVWVFCAGMVVLIPDPIVGISFVALLLCGALPIETRARLASLLPAGAAAMAALLAATIALPEVGPLNEDYLFVTWFVGLLMLSQASVLLPVLSTQGRLPRWLGASRHDHGHDGACSRGLIMPARESRSTAT